MTSLYANLRTQLPDIGGRALHQQWLQARDTMAAVNSLSTFRAMSVGTREMLFKTTVAIGARRVLDIGTYVGTSALAFALAVGEEGSVVTLDIVDANAPDGYWHVDGRAECPKDMMARAGVASRVEFVTQSGLDYIQFTEREFDFICIDGGKNFAEDYATALGALARLAPGGLLFFDDVFPTGKPIYPGGYHEDGPWRVVKKLTEDHPLRHVQIDQTPDGGKVRCAFVVRAE